VGDRHKTQPLIALAGKPDCRRAEEDEACRASPIVKFS
jgi:hypothetical protein